MRSGQITTDQLQTALDQQARTRQPLGNTLMALGFVSEETMRGALCAQMHVNFFDLDLIKLDPSLARLVNEKYASRRRVVPLFRAGSMLVVGVIWRRTRFLAGRPVQALSSISQSSG